MKALTHNVVRHVHGSTCGHVVRLLPLGPKALARIERQRTQSIPFASRERFDVSGSPRESRPGIWSALANRPVVGQNGAPK